MKPEDIFGLLGAIFYIVALWRTGAKKSKSKPLLFELDVLLAAGFMSYYAFYKHAYFAILVNLVWIFVMSRGVLSYAERHSARKSRR